MHEPSVLQLLRLQWDIRKRNVWVWFQCVEPQCFDDVLFHWKIALEGCGRFQQIQFRYLLSEIAFGCSKVVFTEDNDEKRIASALSLFSLILFPSVHSLISLVRSWSERTKSEITTSRDVDRYRHDQAETWAGTNMDQEIADRFRYGPAETWTGTDIWISRSLASSDMDQQKRGPVQIWTSRSLSGTDIDQQKRGPVQTWTCRRG